MIASNYLAPEPFQVIHQCVNVIRRIIDVVIAGQIVVVRVRAVEPVQLALTPFVLNPVQHVQLIGFR
jgi:hypothetical protein